MGDLDSHRQTLMCCAGGGWSIAVRDRVWRAFLGGCIQRSRVVIG